MRTNRDNPKDRKAVAQLNDRLEKWHRRIAALLNHKTKNWTPVKLKAALLIFCLLMGCASLYIAGNALCNGHGPPIIHAHHVKLPAIKNRAHEKHDDTITIKQNRNEHQ